MIRTSTVVMSAVLASAAAFAIPLAASPGAASGPGASAEPVRAVPSWVEALRKSCRYRSVEAGPGFCELVFGG